MWTWVRLGPGVGVGMEMEGASVLEVLWVAPSPSCAVPGIPV